MPPELNHRRRRTTSPHVDPRMPASRVVDLFGGMANFCDATGFGRSTVFAWMRNGLIPAKWRFDEQTGETESYQHYILRVAHQRGIGLMASDFIEA